VVALAGGVGGAKLADGLARVLLPENLVVVVNIGDDFEHLGLTICPDIDTVCYNLAGVENPDTGWGREDESWHAIETLRQLDGETWFQLGDYDLGLHLARTSWIKQGLPLSAITARIAAGLGIAVTILPASDQRVATIVETDRGRLPFQDYFVRQRCEPIVQRFIFQNIERAVPAPGVLEAVEGADLVIICPSNPWVSIDPILGLPGIREAIQRRPVVAVSPLIGGRALKGPAAKMYTEMGIQPSARAVARHYQDILDGLVIDHEDAQLADPIREMGVQVRTLPTIMRTRAERQQLARSVLEWTAARFDQVK
jgi:LPPG:FO 2-phospho-L-lactate transferase